MWTVFTILQIYGLWIRFPDFHWYIYIFFVKNHSNWKKQMYLTITLMVMFVHKGVVLPSHMVCLESDFP